MKLVREHINEISLGGSHLERTGTGIKGAIKRWLDEHDIKDYIINNDLTIDIKFKDNTDLNDIDIPDFIKFRHIAGNLDLSNTNINVTSLLDGLFVAGGLNLNNSTITSLPKGLEVEWNLTLSNTSITSLPNDLKVGWWLDLSYTPITSLPNNFKAAWNLDLKGT